MDAPRVITCNQARVCLNSHFALLVVLRVNVSPVFSWLLVRLLLDYPSHALQYKRAQLQCTYLVWLLVQLTNLQISTYAGPIAATGAELSNLSYES